MRIPVPGSAVSAIVSVATLLFALSLFAQACGDSTTPVQASAASTARATTTAAPTTTTTVLVTITTTAATTTTTTTTTLVATADQLGADTGKYAFKAYPTAQQNTPRPSIAVLPPRPYMVPSTVPIMYHPPVTMPVYTPPPTIYIYHGPPLTAPLPYSYHP